MIAATTLAVVGPGSEQVVGEPRIRLLGPLRIHGTPGTPPPMVSRTLALLALNAGQGVGAAQLADELWSDNPPRTFTTTLHTYIYHMRKHLLGIEVETLGSCYMLKAEPDEVDALRLIRVVKATTLKLKAGRLEDVRVDLEAALKLLRGAPLVSMQCGVQLTNWAAEIGDYIQTASLRRFEVGLMLGEHRELLNELTAAWRRDLTREDLAALLILALCRCMRLDKVADVFRATRSELADERGTDPCPQLERLYRRGLDNDRELLEPHRTLDILAAF